MFYVLILRETPDTSTLNALNKPSDCMSVFAVVLACVYAPQAIPCHPLGFPQGENGFGLQRLPHPRRRNDQLELASSDASTKPLSVAKEVSDSGGCSSPRSETNSLSCGVQHFSFMQNMFDTWGSVVGSML